MHKHIGMLLVLWQRMMLHQSRILQAYLPVGFELVHPSTIAVIVVQAEVSCRARESFFDLLLHCNRGMATVTNSIVSLHPTARKHTPTAAPSKKSKEAQLARIITMIGAMCVAQ